MKKKILKNVAILTFALFGLGIIGNNVFATDILIRLIVEGEEDKVRCTCGSGEKCLANGYGKDVCWTTNEKCSENSDSCGPA